MKRGQKVLEHALSRKVLGTCFEALSWAKYNRRSNGRESREGVVKEIEAKGVNSYMPKCTRGNQYEQKARALDEVLHSEIYRVPGRYVPRLLVLEIVPYAAAADPVLLHIFFRNPENLDHIKCVY